ncbi:hypothetical protein CCMA1212_001537 [Trichoderma ghanense]|uniref:Uncharacterized protein n=1 Tax=Trichoderma ghanense TaxID=65468 RepID=A0ABY2HEP9_9HYPO
MFYAISYSKWTVYTSNSHPGVLRIGTSAAASRMGSSDLDASWSLPTEAVCILMIAIQFTSTESRYAILLLSWSTPSQAWSSYKIVGVVTQGTATRIWHERTIRANRHHRAAAEGPSRTSPNILEARKTEKTTTAKETNATLMQTKAASLSPYHQSADIGEMIKASVAPARRSPPSLHNVLPSRPSRQNESTRLRLDGATCLDQQQPQQVLTRAPPKGRAASSVLPTS